MTCSGYENCCTSQEHFFKRKYNVHERRKHARNMSNGVAGQTELVHEEKNTVLHTGILK